jgi:predicted DNA-binding transcriptional regulator YafY
MLNSCLPWHGSQQIFTKNGKTFMRLLVRPDFELTQKIMMQGDLIEVLKPEWLREKVSKILSKASRKYEK